MVKKINENTLRQIIRNVISEAYGTPPRDDREYYDELSDLTSGYELPTTMLRTLKDLHNEIMDYDNDHVDAYSKNKDLMAAVKHIRSAILYTERFLKNEKMDMGLQPDKSYDSRHSADGFSRQFSDDYRSTHKSPLSAWPHNVGY